MGVVYQAEDTRVRRFVALKSERMEMPRKCVHFVLTWFPLQFFWMTASFTETCAGSSQFEARFHKLDGEWDALSRRS
jgi:hypothetical protein